ncbi:hypothetical protein [Streptomyces brasiliensis]|uniref:Cysteinyl-tRNA synthetase n=1 Tax=Streptomyces brasiliensis TaxID=1954 RepID=A0A917LCK0_9ACTN|nr:hypothetical protein [Streptomyces brasiliensis]GGJ53429.1 hypothetical protein GCM10010121_075270 [Streptomyces brasiliensis]
MLRIVDARTGDPVQAAPARRGLTRVEAHAPSFTPTSLRVLLTTDLLVRALELGGTPVWSMLAAGRQHAELRAAATTLGIRPFEDGHDLAAGLGEAQIVHVVGEGGPVPETGVVLRVAEVSDEVGVCGNGGLDGRFTDPAALRLTLLCTDRDAPVRLDAGALEEAGRMLARWRRAVAGWARQPSRAIPDDVRGRLRAAWEDNLDVPEVLRVLEWVETAGDLPDGARFETYAYADRLLGLELARDLGSLS